MLNEIRTRFPLICQLADGALFQTEVAALNSMRAANTCQRSFAEAVYDSNLQTKELMMAVSFPIAASKYADSAARDIEADLQTLLPVIGETRLRTVFGQKLLARNENQWLDTRHEIAVASASLGFFDANTVELEKPIPGAMTNSDLYGLRNGHSYRIDATVVHDNWPPQSNIGSIRTYTRSTMDRAELEDLTAMNPPGVITFANAQTNPSTHQPTPLSTKVWQALQRKIRQCEPGCINLIALGLPRPLIDDHGAEDAVLGVFYMIVDRETGKSTPVRHGTGPFVPAQYSDDVVQYVDPFRIMSAVWLCRWKPDYPFSKVLLNPNATTPLINTDRDALTQVGLARASRQ